MAHDSFIQIKYKFKTTQKLAAVAQGAFQMSTTEKDYDPIKNPRPEDLESYGIGNALLWFSVILVIGLAIYYFVF